MGEGLLLLIFKRRHTIQYFQATDQINSIQGSSINPFFFEIWIFKKCIYMYFGVKQRYVHLLSKMRSIFLF